MDAYLKPSSLELGLSPGGRATSRAPVPCPPSSGGGGSAKPSPHRISASCSVPRVQLGFPFSLSYHIPDFSFLPNVPPPPTISN